MGLEVGSWNFKEKPRGLWRHVLRLPIHLFRSRLGFLLGDRFVMIDHVGRTSGRAYQVVVEVVQHDDDTGEYIVCSGTGPNADWYRNLVASPAPCIQVRNRRWTPTQRLLDANEAGRRFAKYEADHPKAAARLLSSMGNAYDGSDEDRIRMMTDMPMVAFGSADDLRTAPRPGDHDAEDRRQGSDTTTLMRHFGRAPLLPLWIAEPDVDLAPCVVDALVARAATGWYGYETRPEAVVESFQQWALSRHGWETGELETIISPSVGTSVAVLIDELTEPGDGVIIQPPVFTDFKTIVSHSGRTAVRNPLILRDGRYEIDLDDLARTAEDPANTLLILCNPHNPVGRVWTRDELSAIADICAAHDVFVLADEIHADLALPPHRCTPFATIAERTPIRWAATHGPIKTFGLAGVCDTLIITDDDEAAQRFRTRSSQFHLTRNNVFAIEAFDAAYRGGAGWLDDMLSLISTNVRVLADGLPSEIGLIVPEGTYLAWLDFRALGIDVAALPSWLAEDAGVALSPGHWFGREGAGFARMTTASSTATIEQATQQLASAVAAR